MTTGGVVSFHQRVSDAAEGHRYAWSSPVQGAALDRHGPALHDTCGTGGVVPAFDLDAEAARLAPFRVDLETGDAILAAGSWVWVWSGAKRKDNGSFSVSPRA